MSGLLCIHSADGIHQARQACLAALRRLAHRGRDGEGSVLRPSLFLGTTGAPPCVSGDGTIIVGLDGDVHNWEELAHSLKARGYEGDLSSDRAVVLGAYAEYGEQCLERLRGVWALVLWDERERRLLVGRDPLGVRPLYYYVGARQIMVASEIKSLLALDHDARTMDRRWIRSLVHEGRIDDWTDTCFSRIRPVPPGTGVRLDRQQITTNRYWSLRPSTDRALSLRDMREELIGATERSTPTNVAVGLALSGGIDSSTIAGILTRASLRSARRIHAFSIRPPNTTDESLLIDATIRHTGIAHTYVPLEALDYPRALARLIDFHDEPIQHSGVFYQYVLRERIAEAGCRAVLVGYGADEIFGGYRYLAPAFLTALAAAGRLSDCARFVRGAGEFLEVPLPRIINDALTFVRWQSRAVLLSPLKRTRLYAACRRRKDGRVPNADDADVLTPLDRDEPSAPSPAPADFDLSGVDGGRIFFKALLQCFRRNIALLVRLEDRNATAHGIDLCTPFMDAQLVQVALAFPFHLYMAGGRNKALLRDAAQDLLAPEVSAFRRKLATPGSDGYLAFDVLRPELLDLVGSASFYESGLWSRRCAELYKADLARKDRGHLWFRVYMVQKWYERVVKAPVH